MFRCAMALVGMACGLTIASVQLASAEVVARCGASKGFAYYPEIGLVQAGQGGWKEDGITRGEILLLRDGTEFDVIHTDAAGTRSSKADGARVIGISATDARIIVLVAYPEVVETYALWFSTRELLWTQIKAAGLVDKAATFRSECR